MQVTIPEIWYSKIVLEPGVPTCVDCFSYSRGGLHPQPEYFSGIVTNAITNLNSKSQLGGDASTIVSLLVNFDEHSRDDYQKVLSNLYFEIRISDRSFGIVPLNNCKFSRLDPHPDLPESKSPYLYAIGTQLQYIFPIPLSKLAWELVRLTGNYEGKDLNKPVFLTVSLVGYSRLGRDYAFK